MPDIAMCSGNGCPIRESCYRYTATPNPYAQSYLAPQYDTAAMDCEHFWPDREVSCER